MVITQFIGHVDEILREVQYRPSALGGSSHLIKTSLCGQLPADLYARFRSSIVSDKKGAFENQLRVFMAQPKKFRLELCSESSGNRLALIVYDKSSPDKLIIPLFRVARSPLSETLLRYLLRQIVTISSREKRTISRITDTDFNESFGRALEEVGFSKMESAWAKYNISFIGQSMDLDARLKTYSDDVIIQDIRCALVSAVQSQDPIALIDIERRLWPAKVLDEL